MLGLDAVDCQILEELQINARIKNKDLAARVGLSASACFERVKRLEKAGIIRGYRAVVDTGALGARFDAWVEVVLEKDAAATTERFLAYLHHAPVILSAHQLARPHAFLLHVLATSGAAWSEFLARANEASFAFEVTHVSVVIDCVKAPAASLPPPRARRSI